MRSVCCNRDIVKTGTEVRVDWVSGFERRATELETESLMANCIRSGLAGSVERRS
jgi:hypothetical protein